MPFFRHADIGPVPGRVRLRGPHVNQHGPFGMAAGPTSAQAKGGDLAAAQAGLEGEPDQGGVFPSPAGWPRPATPSHVPAGAADTATACIRMTWS